jgi:hypothetical protein
MNVAADMAIGNITFRGTTRKTSVSIQRTDQVRQQTRQATPLSSQIMQNANKPAPPPVVSRMK